MFEPRATQAPQRARPTTMRWLFDALDDVEAEGAPDHGADLACA